jgi:tetratricopeptide (TPR) repeat protein
MAVTSLAAAALLLVGLESSAVRAASPAPAARRPPSFDDVSRRAAQAREGNRLGDAIRLYGQAVKLRPRWDEGWWYLATLLYDSDRYAEARPAFARFLALVADSGPAWVLRGLCDFRVRDHAGALEHIDRGLALGVSARPEILRVARYHQALLLVQAAQFELAVPPLTLLARAETETPELDDAIGLMMLRLPLLPADLPEPKRALVRQAGRAGYLHLARRGEEARRAFEELLSAFPDERWVHYASGVALLAGDPEKGLAELRRETERHPDAVYAHLEIAFELLRKGDNAGARPAAAQAVALAPGLFAAHNALGRALVELGELERGVRELEAAVSLAPDSPEMHYSLARGYAKAGRKEEADRERAAFAELDRKRRAQRGEPGAEDPADRPPPPRAPL